MEKQMFSTKDAAAYLEMTVAGLWYHIQLKHISPQKIGATLVFTKAQLDEFNASRRPPGRPKSVQEEN